MISLNTDETTDHVGTLLRDWRRRRRLSQQAVSEICDISTRHLSHVETGKARPSAAMIGRLGSALEVPLRTQRRMFTAAGFVPPVSELGLDSPALAQVNDALELILAGYEPYPALVIDGGWDLVTANAAAYRLLDGVPADLLEPPVNIVRLSLHPRGLAPRIVNLDQWRAGILGRIAHEHDLTGDPRLAALLAEHPGGSDARNRGAAPPHIVLTVRVRFGEHELAFLTTTTVFGTPADVTVAELAIEALLPADDITRAALASPS